MTSVIRVLVNEQSNVKIWIEQGYPAPIKDAPPPYHSLTANIDGIELSFVSQDIEKLLLLFEAAKEIMGVKVIAANPQ